MITAIVAALIGVTLLAASNAYGPYFAGERAFRSAFGAIVGLAVAAVLLIWRYAGVHRRYWRKNADERLVSLRESVLAELESARQAQRLPETEEIRRGLRDARAFVPEHPEVQAIAQLLESGEREAASNATREPVPRPVVQLRRLFADPAGRAIPVAAACTFACGIVMVCAGALSRTIWLGVAGFSFQWGGLATLLRRNPLIVWFAGSFLFSALLTVAILQALAGSR